MNAYIGQVERVIVASLVVMMVLVLVLATVEVGWVILNDIVTPPIGLLGIDKLLDVFGLFLLILVGVELLATVSAYATEHVVQVDVVLEVALIAVCRKVIVLEIKEHSVLNLLGIAALVITLGAARYLEGRNRPAQH